MTATDLSEFREALIANLREGRIQHDQAKAVYAHPYSSHDAAVAFHMARGFWNATAWAVETFDQHFPEVQHG